TLLEQRLLVTVSIYPLVGPPVSASIHSLQSRLTIDNPQYFDTSRDTVATAYSLVRDIDGAPVAIMQVTSPRDIRRQGERTVRFFFIWLYFIGAGFLVIVFLT